MTPDAYEDQMYEMNRELGCAEEKAINARVTRGHDEERRKARTPAIRRAVDVLWGHVDHTEDLHELASDALGEAINVDELAESLARAQWNSLPLVAAGQMADWDAAGASLGRFADVERESFRERVRPFAVALRRDLLGGAA